MTRTTDLVSFARMSNVLEQTKQQQVLALGRLGWPASRIAAAVHVDRATVTGYLRAAGLAIDLVLVGLVLFVQLYTIWDIDAFHMRLGEKDPTDLIVGGILIALVFEATRRAVEGRQDGSGVGT